MSSLNRETISQQAFTRSARNYASISQNIWMGLSYLWVNGKVFTRWNYFCVHKNGVCKLFSPWPNSRKFFINSNWVVIASRIITYFGKSELAVTYLLFIAISLLIAHSLHPRTLYTQLADIRSSLPTTNGFVYIIKLAKIIICIMNNTSSSSAEKIREFGTK